MVVPEVAGVVVVPEVAEVVPEVAEVVHEVAEAVPEVAGADVAAKIGSAHTPA